ncbi:hypothetical protein PIB30_116901 [Stylosanthes scabra]|uniref:Uncharacterized protein n=1 Tax=Stylosanthes scabra TaxID=79078 RepID=A0ABU6TDY9_9FABA|nr:hypothetical protein [Stylosanthes scabra]
MKWGTLLKDFREKVGFTQSPPSASSSSAAFSSASASASFPSASSPTSLPSSSPNNNAFSASQIPPLSPSRDKHELELDFKRFWEDFRSSSSEKEKEASLILSIDAFCKLVKQRANVAQLVTM